MRDAHDASCEPNAELVEAHTGAQRDVLRLSERDDLMSGHRIPPVGRARYLFMPVRSDKWRSGNYRGAAGESLKMPPDITDMSNIGTCLRHRAAISCRCT